MAQTDALQTQGLQISPIRRELKVDPGTTGDSNVVVANLTKSDLTVSVIVREFSVVDPAYNYSFEVSRYDWLKVATPQLTLKPGESQTVPYSVSPPANATPGGYYFTVIASAQVKSGAADSTIQAASLLYTTVNGALDQSGRLDKAELPTLIFSPDITYAFDTTDTGNVYYTIYSVATLSNAFDSSQGQSTAHILMPHAVRHLTGTLPAPRLPGVYTATLGYRTDSGALITTSKPVVYLPLWSIVAFIGLLFVAYQAVRLFRRHRHAHRTR